MEEVSSSGEKKATNSNVKEEFDLFMKDTIKDTLEQMREVEAQQAASGAPKQERVYKVDPLLGDRKWQEAQKMKSKQI